MNRVPSIRITSDGSVRVTGDGAIRIVNQLWLPEVDIAAVADVYFPGIVVQANLTEAIAVWLIDHDWVVSDADVPAILARANAILAAEVVTDREPVTQEPYPLELPPYPTGLPRFPDSNPATDGWSITTDEKVVRGRAVRVEATSAAAIIGAPEFAALAAEYIAESKIDGMPDPAARIETYETLEKAGIIHPFGAWDGDPPAERLIGFLGVLTAPLPHYPRLIACTESFFVSRAARGSGAGLALLKAAENKARELGATGLLMSAPVSGALGKVLPRHGYRLASLTFFKRFHDA